MIIIIKYIRFTKGGNAMQHNNRGLAFLGTLLASFGVGFYFDEILVSLIIGLGLAFIMMALVK